MKGTSIVQCDKCLKKYAYQSTGNPYPGGKDKETAICPYCGAEGPSEFIRVVSRIFRKNVCRLWCE